MSEESKEPEFTKSNAWSELSKWEKANDVLIYGYLCAEKSKTILKGMKAGSIMIKMLY